MPRNSKTLPLTAFLVISGIALGAFSSSTAISTEQTSLKCESDKCRNGTTCIDATPDQTGCDIIGFLTCETYDCNAT
jgi:hypothetical protein